MVYDSLQSTTSKYIIGKSNFGRSAEKWHERQITTRSNITKCVCLTYDLLSGFCINISKKVIQEISGRKCLSPNTAPPSCYTIHNRYGYHRINFALFQQDQKTTSSPLQLPLEFSTLLWTLLIAFRPSTSAESFLLSKPL